MAALRSFALKVVTKLRDEVIVAKVGTFGFCMALVANLEEAEIWLDSGPDEHRVRELLSHLDGLIQALLNWRLGYTPQPKPGNLSGRFDKNQFLGLSLLLNNKPWGKDQLRSFANSHRATKRRAELLEALALFKAPVTIDTGFDVPESAEPETMQYYEDYQYTTSIHKLYSYLSEIHCEDSKTKITAHLRLRAVANKSIESASASFRIFFLDHPHLLTTRSNSHRWQDAVICVLGKRVKIKDEGDATPEKIDCLIHSPQLCDMIKVSSSQIQLRFDLAEQGLVVKEPIASAFQGYLLKSPAYISLDEILDMKKKPTKRMRLLLCCYLARAFRDFYGSGWMEVSWTKRDVFFMFDPESNIPTGIYFHEPFLKAFHPEPARKVIKSSFALASFRLHQFPNILALGIMLMEIELGLKIENYDPKCYDEHGKLDVNIAYLTAQSIFAEKPELWEQNDTFNVVRGVIATCLATSPAGDPFWEFRDGEHKSRLRDAINKQIVGRLQKQCRETWWTDKLDPETWEAPVYPIGINSDALPRPFQSVPPLPAVLASSIHSRMLIGHRHTSAPPLAANASQPERWANSAPNLSSVDWFHQLETNMNSALRIRDSERDALAARVKVAILDTGLDSEFSEGIRKARRIAKYYDFVDETSSSPRDDSGHGTRIFQLMQKVCEAAEFYIGRVWESGRMSERTPGLMEKAIDFARTDWAVDIIVLSSGFEEHYDEIERAIEDANRARILTFAAASNHGNLTPINFPGRLYGQGKVLCIFSANAMAKSSSQHTFNPSPLQMAKHRSFAMLGEDIVLENVREVLSGTSFSTAVGAAIAARILDFSRHPDTRPMLDRATDLKKVEGMLSVFGKMSVSDGNYRCIVPWTICEMRSIVGEDRAETRRRKRLEACSQMRDALRRIYEA